MEMNVIYFEIYRIVYLLFRTVFYYIKLKFE